MAPMIAYTLPAMQLVCHIVIPVAPGSNISNSGPNLQPVPTKILNVSEAKTWADSSPDINPTSNSFVDINPTSNPAFAESSTVPVAEMLTDGYERFPELGAAFKYHRNEKMEWHDAEKRCVEEGGHLVVPDSWPKHDVVKSLLSSEDIIHVGIYSTKGTSNWHDVRTGSPVPDILWKSGEPNGIGQCVGFFQNDRGVERIWCTRQRHFVCEREI